MLVYFSVAFSIKGDRRFVLNQTQYYLQKNELLYSYQSDVRAGHSIDTWLSQLIDIILNGAENGKHTGMVLIDIQKAHFQS